MRPRGLLFVIAAGLLAGCALGPDRRGPEVTWARIEDAGASVRLVAAADGPGGVRLVMECAPHSGIVDLTVIGRLGDAALVVLRSGKVESRHPGAGVADIDLDGAMDVQTQVPADDPALSRFADTGELGVALGRRRIALPNGFAPGHDFLNACRN